MPVMDRVATVASLKRLNPAVRIVCASGLGSVEREAQVTALGVRHFLPKPYSAHSLLRTLGEVLDATPPAAQGVEAT